MLARVAARVGVGGPLEAIFLVGDRSPHIVLFTRRGLATTLRRAGWTLRRRASITEVAGELPMRMRLPGRLPRLPLRVAGELIGSCGRWWSDTEVAVATRD